MADGFRPLREARRPRLLAALQPVLDLERDKQLVARAGGRDRDWEDYDMRALALATVDAAAVNRGAEGLRGAREQVVVDAVAEIAAAMEPDRDPSEHTDVAGWVLDRLAQPPGATASNGHVVVWRDPERGWAKQRMRVVIVTRDVEVGSDGVEHDTVHLADDAAALLMMAINTDIPESQTAATAVMREQVLAGRLDDALSLAEQSLRLSEQYRAQIDRHVDTARRDLHEARWTDRVEPELLRAEQHIRGRASAETALLDAFGQAGSPDDADTARVADRIRGLVRQSTVVLNGLLRRVLSARPEFLAEQERQRFAPPPALMDVNLYADVFGPAMGLPVDADGGSGALERLPGVFQPARTPSVPSLALAMQTLCAPTRERTSEPAPQAVLDLEDAGVPLRRFDPHVWEGCERVLGRVVAPVRLSEVVTGQEPDVQTLTMLLAVRAAGISEDDPTVGRYGREALLDGVDVVPLRPGPLVILDEVTGPDLLLGPRGHATEVGHG